MPNDCRNCGHNIGFGAITCNPNSGRHITLVNPTGNAVNEWFRREDVAVIDDDGTFTGATPCPAWTPKENAS